MSLTPMMAQFMKIKAEHQDYLLFYRMGDFYELFFDDAKIASDLLNIALTKRGKHQDQDIPMAGVPVKAADEYLRKLIEAGQKVAICEQMEDPAEAKKRGAKAVVARDVVRLITAGTLTEDHLVDMGQAHWLLALYQDKKTSKHPTQPLIGMSWIDLSTGDFCVRSMPSTVVESEIARLNPAEIILADEDYGQKDDLLFQNIIQQKKCVLSMVDPSFFSRHTAEERLCELFNVQTLQSFGQFTPLETSTMAGLVAYIERTQAGGKPALSPPHSESNIQTMTIDSVTRASLEILTNRQGKKKDSLFDCIDYTCTLHGRRLFASYLSAPSLDLETIRSRYDGIEIFLNHPSLREDIRLHLKHIPDFMRAFSRLSLHRGGPKDLQTLLIAMHQGHALLESLHENFRDKLKPKLLQTIIEALEAIPYELHHFLENALKEDVPVHVRDGGFVKEGFHEGLDEAQRLCRDTRSFIQSLEQRYRDETGAKNLKIKYNNVIGYFIEVSVLHAEKLSDFEGDYSFIHRQSLVNAVRFVTEELNELESRINNAGVHITKIEKDIFDECLERVLHHHKTIRLLSEHIALCDVLSAMAELAFKHHYNRPQIDHSRAFSITGGRHPVVEHACAQLGKKFVPNDCDLSPQDNDPYGRLQVITGPNMGGKSTYLRQNALIAIMAQAGCFVPAEKAHIGLVDQLFSRVGASDDLAQGQSTFMVEMVETASILNQAKEKALVILDEVGRGTATYDGVSLAWSIVEYLHDQSQTRGLFATHYHELTALETHLQRVDNYHVEVKEWNHDIIFLHRIVKGAANRSYGLHVAQIAGLPRDVLKRARSLLTHLENHRDTHSKGNSSSPKEKGLFDDLPLFSHHKAPHQEDHAYHDKIPDLIDHLYQDIEPDMLSPRDALDKLYEIKQQLSDYKKDMKVQ